MREITDHKVNGANETLKIQVLDQPGSGGANHFYTISGMDLSHNPSSPRFLREGCEGVDPKNTLILFQNGPIKEAGVNGVTQEVLLAIVADRLRGFQSGPYATADNASALTHVEAAMSDLQKRTKERLARGVEGTLQK